MTPRTIGFIQGAIAGFCLCIVLFIIVSRFNVPSTERCLPADATSYDGAGVWFNDAGRAVALADSEDSLIWCDGRQFVDDTVRP